MIGEELPSVAVSIPTFNQSDYLPLAVRSAFHQNYAGHIEVWIADDASTDETSRVIDLLEQEFPGLNVIRQPRNVGIAENATAAMKAPETDFVVRLDSDDMLGPQFVSRLVALMQAYPNAGYAHCAVREIDKHGGLRRTRRLGRPTGFQPADAALRAALRWYRTTANIVLFRKAALAAVNYCEGRANWAEDYDLSVRLADAGYGNVYCTDVLASYRIWDDPKGVRARRKALELVGYKRLFDETLQPAWERRGWSRREVLRQRDRLAARHAPSCFGRQYTELERAELVHLLVQLGNGPRTRLRLALGRRGLSGVFVVLDALPERIKNAIKAVLAAGAMRPSGSDGSASAS